MEDYDYSDPVAGMIKLGKPEDLKGWLDYQDLGIRREHIPDLIRLVLDKRLTSSDVNDSALWAGVHAWRALGQLEAEDATEPLIQLFAWIDAKDDDWVLEELPVVFGMIGRSAIPLLADYLADQEHALFGRIAAAHALSEIGVREAEARQDCVAILSAALERFDEEDPTINAFLVSYLIDLKAVETAPLMERAFDAGRADVAVLGGWEDVQVELGLREGPEEPRPPLNFEGFPALQKRARAVARHRLQQIGRNEPCWCGSGRKYKHCHMRLDEQRVRE